MKEVLAFCNKWAILYTLECFKLVIEGLTWENRQEEKIEGICVGKQEEANLSLFTDDMTLYVENPKDFTQKSLYLINKCSKVAV